MNLYTDIDEKCCAWTQALVDDGLILPGKVLCKSILDITPDELQGYQQISFFNGISGWPLALKLANWPAGRPVWLASLPCQPFSCAGKQQAQADPRHLWPHFYRLIRECRPECVFGEQVAGAIGHGWLDGVCGDLEAENYAVGAVVLGAHSAGAPHIRQRLYWVATGSAAIGMANSIGSRRDETWGGSEINAAHEPKSGLAPGGMGDLLGAGLARRQGQQPRNDGPQFTTAERAGGSTFWHDSVWHPCLDGKARRIPAESQPVFQRLVDGLPEGMDAVRIASLGFPLAPKIAGRAGILKGYGNAIVPELAAEFIRSYRSQVEEICQDRVKCP